MRRLGDVHPAAFLAAVGSRATLRQSRLSDRRQNAHFSGRVRVVSIWSYLRWQWAENRAKGIALCATVDRGQ